MDSSHQVIGLGTTPNDGTGDYPRLAGTKINNNFSGLYAGRVSVRDKMFGAVGDGIADDTAAIQAAIDFAYNNRIAEVYMPAGTYRTTDHIWLDAPGNGRDNYSNPPNCQFSLRLVGAGWGGGNNPGTTLRPAAGKAGVIVGPGQYMGVYRMSIIGQPASRSLLQESGVHILCAGGGAHGTTIEDCQIANFQYGVLVGQNHDALGDSNVILRCQISTCMYGVMIFGSQQFINTIRDSTIQNCKYGVWSRFNLFVEISGGNFSTWDSFTVAVAFSAVTDWTYTSFTDTLQDGGGDYFNKKFTVHIDSNDYYMLEADIFCLKTSVGFVPLMKDSWNDSSKMLTLKFHRKWCQEAFGYGGSAPSEAQLDTFLTDVINDPTAYLYAGEYITTFGTAGIHARGVHIENANAVTRVARAYVGWNIGTETRLEDIFLNWDPSNGGGKTQPVNSAEYALYALSCVWPTLDVSYGCGLYMDQCNIAGLWRLERNDADFHRIVITSRNAFANVTGQIVIAGSNPRDNEYGGTREHGVNIETLMRGAGHFDRMNYTAPAIYTVSGTSKDLNSRWTGISQSPHVGYFPAPWVTPRLTQAMLDAVLAPSLPTIFNPALDWAAGEGYDAICGDCIYQISGMRDTINPRNVFVKFDHLGFSWGQDIPSSRISWQHDSEFIPLIKFTGYAAAFLFPGLHIKLDYGAGEFFSYIILSGGQNSEGFTRVAPISYWPGGTHSGTGVIQQPFVVTKIGNQRADALTDTGVAGKRYQVGDIIWKKTPAGSGSMGWMCTTAGVAGTDAVFKAMPNLAA